jgi:hypothetical protein
MKVVNIVDSPAFADDIPLTYRRATFLKQALDAYYTGRATRVEGSLGGVTGTRCCMVGLFVDVANLRKWGYSLGAAGDIVTYPRGADGVPLEVIALGRDFLDSVVSFSDNNANWNGDSRSTLTAAGREALRDLIEQYEMSGISSNIGLTAYTLD